MTEKTHEKHMPCPFRADCRNFRDRCDYAKDGITVREDGQVYIYTIYHDCERSREYFFMPDYDGERSMDV